MMKNLTQTVLKSSALLLVLGGNSFAGDVKMFTNRAPSAQEMGSILFSGSRGSTSMSAAPKMKMRSINFNAKKASALPPVSQVAAADTVGLPIQFAYNSADILEQSKPFLNEVGKMMGMAEYSQERLVIEGHTDASGSNGYNQYLSEKRAAAVKNYLVANFQISSNRLMTNGKGEASPLPGKDPFDATNRRVQFYKAP